MVDRPFPRLTAEHPGDIYISPAQPQDESYWLSIRNNHDAVKWSRTPKLIDAHVHRIWFRESLSSTMAKKRRLWIIFFHHPQFLKQAIGIGRIDHRGSWSELSIVLDPLYRGRGLGTRAIQALCYTVDFLSWPMPGVVVNGKNRRSLKTFLKAGFSLQARRWIELRRYKKRGA